MKNKEIAEMLGEIALMLSVDTRPTARFEVRAYQKAALTIGTLQEDVGEIFAKGGERALMELPGIGKGIAGSVAEYIKTGKMKKYDGLKRQYPIDFKALTAIEGLGAKRLIRLYNELGIKDVDDLSRAVKAHKIEKLEGFGRRSEEQIGKGIELAEKGRGRILISEGLPVAEAIVKRIMESGAAEMAVVAGSARRMRETVGDLDILVLSSKPGKAMDFFAGLDEVSSIVMKGPTKTTAWLKAGVTCDVRVIAPESFGAALQYFTGSRDHNVQVRTIAVRKGYKLNEYGLFREGGRPVEAGSEEEIYAKLGMQWMPPEMREARGEVGLAQAKRIPKIVELEDIKGDMHTHTRETDGANTIEEMAEEAMKIGYRYFATTNHTKSLFIARGMDEKKFTGFFKNVDRLNEQLDGKVRIIKGAEVDILKDGSLDLDKKFLEEMECAVGAVHQSLRMDRESMTKRIVGALDSGLIRILAHPTGRELLWREPYAVDLDRVFDAAERNNVALEINSYPSRLDLSDTNIMAASKYKLMFSLGTDAHRTSHMRFMRYGVGTARRGWLAPDRIINTMDMARMLRWLSR